MILQEKSMSVNAIDSLRLSVMQEEDEEALGIE
jgi:hypothetical protein